MWERDKNQCFQVSTVAQQPAWLDVCMKQKTAIIAGGGERGNTVC